jgi:hypothetical protein
MKCKKLEVQATYIIVRTVGRRSNCFEKDLNKQKAKKDTVRDIYILQFFISVFRIRIQSD